MSSAHFIFENFSTFKYQRYNFSIPELELLRKSKNLHKLAKQANKILKNYDAHCSDLKYWNSRDGMA